MIEADAVDDYWRLMARGFDVPTLSDRLERMRPRWMRWGACRAIGVDAFFPGRGIQATAAKGLCAACVVRDDCLDYALAHDDLAGVWSGTSEIERRQLRKPAA